MTHQSVSAGVKDPETSISNSNGRLMSFPMDPTEVHVGKKPYPGLNHDGFAGEPLSRKFDRRHRRQLRASGTSEESYPIMSVAMPKPTQNDWVKTVLFDRGYLPRIRGEAIKVYLAVIEACGGVPDRSVTMSLSLLMRRTQLSCPTVIDSLSHLEDLGLVVSTTRQRGKVKTYYVSDPPALISASETVKCRSSQRQSRCSSKLPRFLMLPSCQVTVSTLEVDPHPRIRDGSCREPPATRS